MHKFVVHNTNAIPQTHAINCVQIRVFQQNSLFSQNMNFLSQKYSNCIEDSVFDRTMCSFDSLVQRGMPLSIVKSSEVSMESTKSTNNARLMLFEGMPQVRDVPISILTNGQVNFSDCDAHLQKTLQTPFGIEPAVSNPRLRSHQRVPAPTDASITTSGTSNPVTNSVMARNEETGNHRKDKLAVSTTAEETYASRLLGAQLSVTLLDNFRPTPRKRRRSHNVTVQTRMDSSRGTASRISVENLVS